MNWRTVKQGKTGAVQFYKKQKWTMNETMAALSQFNQLLLNEPAPKEAPR